MYKFRRGNSLENKLSGYGIRVSKESPEKIMPLQTPTNIKDMLILL